jgi:hypothetical protein
MAPLIEGDLENGIYYGFERAITAAYNCGQGNVMNSLSKNEDVDFHTTQHNYSRQVFEFRQIYMSL